MKGKPATKMTLRHLPRWARWGLGVVAFFALLELVSAALEDGREVPGTMSLDAELLWLTPDLQELIEDAREGRGVDRVDREAPAILAVGDSSLAVVTVGPDKVFSRVLQRRLTDRLVLNAAVPGHSSFQSLRVLQKLLPKIEVGMVVVANLWSDNNFDSFQDKELAAELDSFRSRFLLSAQRVLCWSASGRGMLRWIRGDSVRQVAWGLIGQKLMQGLRRVEIDDYAADLEAMIELSMRHGAGVVFMILPNRMDLLPTRRFWPWTPYRQVMLDTARRFGCPVIDLPARFRESGRSVGDLFIDEMHPSGKGHTIMAHAIFDVIEDRGWLHGGRLCSGAEPTEPRRSYVDPMTSRWIPGEAVEPSVTGVVVHSDAPPTLGISRPILAQLMDATVRERVLDEVFLPNSAPFVLSTPTPRKVYLRFFLGDSERIRIRESARWVESYDFASTVFDLAHHPAWSLQVNLDDHVIHAPPEFSEAWSRILTVYSEMSER